GTHAGSFYVLSSPAGGVVWGGVGVEDAIGMAGEVALETTSDLSVRAAFGTSFLDVVAGSGVVGHAGENRDVQGTAEASVAAAVESLPALGVARRRRDWVAPCERGEGGLVADASAVRPGGVDDRGGDGADPGLLEQGCSWAGSEPVGHAGLVV